MGKDQTLILRLQPFAVRRCLSVWVPDVQIKKFIISAVPDVQIKGKKVRGQNKTKTEHLREDTTFQQDRMAMCLNIHVSIP